MSYLAFCSTCGAGLKYPVTIGNKIYGSSCAEKELGITMPYPQFTGNYDLWKKKKDEEDKKKADEYAKWQKEQRAKISAAEKITAKHWPTQLRIGRAYYKAWQAQNDWERSFMASIARQLGGYSCYIQDYLNCETLEEVKAEYQRRTSGSYKYDENYLLHGKEYRDLDSLSEKQMAIFLRIEDK